jgi:hypothetical protein
VIKDATLEICSARWEADGTQHRIVELLGCGEIVGVDHYVCDHALLSFCESPESAGGWKEARCNGCRAQKYGPEALAMPSRRRDAPASMDVGARGVGVLCIEAVQSRPLQGAARKASKSWHQFLSEGRKIIVRQAVRL